MRNLKLIKALQVGNKSDWYKMQVGDDSTDIYIYDEISWVGVDADSFVKDLENVKSGTIRVHLNTPGGSVFDGVAIYNSLKQHPAKVETYIEGLAASIGSIIALAGDTVKMASNALFMIHDPWFISMGDATELRKAADVLDKIKDTLIGTYVDRTGKDEDEIGQLMSDETWFNAKEAKDAGFIDEIIDQKEDKKNKYDLSIFNNAPEVTVCNKEEKPKLTMMELALELQKRS